MIGDGQNRIQDTLSDPEIGEAKTVIVRLIAKCEEQEARIKELESMLNQALSNSTEKI